MPCRQLFLGVDVAKDWLDIAIHAGGPARRIVDTGPAIDAWIGGLERARIGLIAFEPTGGYERALRRRHVASHGDPRRENSRQRGHIFSKRLYKLRARIERTIGRLKRFKRVALRCDKTDISYSAIASLACALRAG